MDARDPQLRIDVGAVVRVAGEIDLATVGPFRDALEAASACPDAIVCLDLSGVTFIDSTAIHAIGLAVNRVPEGCVIVHEPSAVVRRVFAIVGLDAWPNVHMV
jgi:anti-anti-sigma factor